MRPSDDEPEFCCWRARLGAWWAHHERPLSWLFGSLWTAVLVVGWVTWLLPPAVLLVLALLWLVSVPLFLVMSSRALGHASALCVRCVGRLPVNPAAEAERHAWSLAWAHRWPWPRLLVGFGAVTVSSLMLWQVEVLHTASDALYWVGQVVLLVGVRALGLHARLAPWCPSCRDEGGGDEDAPVSPVSPSGRVSA